MEPNRKGSDASDSRNARTSSVFENSSKDV